MRDAYTERLFGVDVYLGEIEFRIPVAPIRADTVAGDRLRVTYEPSHDELTAPLLPPRADSEQRASAVENGVLPRVQAQPADPEQLAQAKKLLADIRQDQPRDERLRERIRQRWPVQ